MRVTRVDFLIALEAAVVISLGDGGEAGNGHGLYLLVNLSAAVLVG